MKKRLASIILFKKITPFIVVLVVCTYLFSLNSNAQTVDSKVATYLKLVAQGKISEVKPKLSELIATYPDEPGVILLQGVIQDDGSKALVYYQKILDKYPNSRWADHAVWRLIQFYCIVGDTTTANSLLGLFRTKYPSSIFLSPATDAVSMAISNLKYNNSEKYFGSKSYFDVGKKKSEVANKSSSQPESTVSTEKVYYGLQVGIYSTLKSAESEKERFIKLKLRTDIREKIVDGEKKFAVIIGNYSSEQAALEAKKVVEKQCNCSPIIYKK